MNVRDEYELRKSLSLLLALCAGDRCCSHKIEGSNPGVGMGRRAPAGKSRGCKRGGGWEALRVMCCCVVGTEVGASLRTVSADEGL